MALNENLNTKFSTADEAAIAGALNGLTTTLNTVVPDLINLSDEQRQGIRTISNIRFTYASRAIFDFGPSYPALNSISIPLAKATNNLEFYTQLSELENHLKELLDRVVDIKINAGYLAMKFTDDQYVNAKNYRNENVAGADVVYNEQFPLYDRNEVGTPAGGGGTP